jgi:hypothetical protein
MLIYRYFHPVLSEFAVNFDDVINCCNLGHRQEHKRNVQALTAGQRSKQPPPPTHTHYFIACAGD